MSSTHAYDQNYAPQHMLLTTTKTVSSAHAFNDGTQTMSLTHVFNDDQNYVLNTCF
jgi:hypothetical protein